MLTRRVTFRPYPTKPLAAKLFEMIQAELTCQQSLSQRVVGQEWQ